MQQQNSIPRQNQPPFYNSHNAQTQPPQNLQNPQVQMSVQPPPGQLPPNYPPAQLPPNHPQGQPNGQVPEPLSPYKSIQQQPKEAALNPPNNSGELLNHIKMNPYTQVLSGLELTYSVLPKKQQTLFGTNNRVLILKGLESIAYARELPANKQLPFNSFQDVPKPKASFPISEIEKCQAIQQKLSITFSGAKKVLWEFECPTKACAVEWAKKIDSATITLNDFKQSGYHSLEQFLRNKKDIDLKRRLQGSYQVNNFLNKPIENQMPNNVNMNVSFNQNPPSPMKAITSEGPNIAFNNQNNLSHSRTVPLGSNINQNPNYLQQSAHNLLSTPQMDFIANQVPSNSYQPEKMFGKSMSKITSFEKEGIRLQLAKMRRNWLQELVGGEEEVELIMDFKNYVERIASVLINQLYIPNQHKIFPPIEQTKEHAAYMLEDVYLEVYYHTQDTQDRKHPRYQLATLEFKNMDYLLSVTKNEGNLKVPFMVLFEYKGFLGMAKSRVAEPNAPPKNRQFYGQLNIRDFEDTARINAETLLNQSKCKIVAYERKTPLSATMSNRRIYFVDTLTELLPVQKQYDNNPCKVLRAELLQDDSFEGLIFRDKRRPIYPQKLNQLIERKVDEFIRMVQQEEEYFTNSKELAQLIHLSGLNVRHLGRIYLKARLGWFRRILQGQIIARSIKSLFRYDIQNVVMIQAERQTNKSTQDQAEKRRVISFLNVLFGNSESTSGIWKRINAISRDKFGVVVAQNSIGDTNVQFLMQAVQTHLKIVMNQSIYSKIRFQSTQTFEPNDFQRFEFKTTIYDLQFSNLFDQIDQCLTSQTSESFYNLSAILIKETSTRIPYIDILRRHPIHDRISEFLLNFTSPGQSKQLYSRLQLGLQPSRFLYQSKLAEIKWFLKANKPEQIKQISTFIFQHARRWLGTIHPLFAQLNRLQASYYSNYIEYYQTALKHANQSLNMQRKIFDGQAEPLWKDYFLLGKIYFHNRNTEEGMKNLIKAKDMVNVRGLKQLETYSELNLLLCKGFFTSQRYRQAYNIVKDLYGLIKTDKDQRILAYSLQAVKWIKQLFEVNQDHTSFVQFLQTELASNMRAFVDYPNVLTSAIKMLALPSLKHAIVRRSRNSGRLMGLCEEVGKIAESTQNSLTGYIKERIVQGSFPRSFLIQLKEIDMICDEITGGQMLDRWRQFYMTSSQLALDSLGTSQVPRGFEFLASLTGLFNLLGRQVLDELHLVDRR